MGEYIPPPLGEMELESGYIDCQYPPEMFRGNPAFPRCQTPAQYMLTVLAPQNRNPQAYACEQHLDVIKGQLMRRTGRDEVTAISIAHLNN